MEQKRLDAFVDISETLRKILRECDSAGNDFTENYPSESDDDGLTRQSVNFLLNEIIETIDYSVHEIDYIINETDDTNLLHTINQILNRK